MESTIVQSKIHCRAPREIDWHSALSSLGRVDFEFDFLCMKRVKISNMDQQKKLKQKFQRNFTWYLENVFPELGTPDMNSFAFGQVTLFCE